ncbi:MULTISPECIES: hypothetical protein [unclassified Neisseria]|uniref:hypothetical protein n=1 Tax=unclassified Neisseria TaxID=2623750 RepID=UPI00266508A8|nr:MULTISPECIES: hypothetical protein [unclassified Neisseria]MDO1510784.1 hypothetical protein [Neisseria sp. MVDL19-042950]MDO1517105.1 hypothetical protein [Neisseria sp. MVDL18-041461]MDO1564436.1 hypothetical protein [Neisseria sp. MVDL20-010259]
MKSPSEELIELISPVLVEKKLFLASDLERYREKIILGVMKPEDWLLAVEKAIDKEKAGAGE